MPTDRMGERRLRGRGNLLVLNGEECRRPLLLNFPRPPDGSRVARLKVQASGAGEHDQARGE